MADGGWEHVGGAYIIQHLIEGAGWKEAGKEEDALENLKEEGIKKEGAGDSLRWAMQNGREERIR